MNLKPLADRVIIKTLPKEETVQSGIIIPDTAKEKPSEGIAVAVGKGKYDDGDELVPMTVKVGDRVIYSKYAGTEIKFDNEEYLIVRESDILAVFKDGSEDEDEDKDEGKDEDKSDDGDDD